MPSLPDKIYSWKKKIIVSDFETCLSMVTAEKRRFWTGGGPGGQSYEVFSTLFAPPNLGAGVTSRKFLNGQTRPGKAGIGGQDISWRRADNLSLKIHLDILGGSQIDRVNRGKSKGCV